MQLELLDCRGGIRMFIENTEIPNLRTLVYQSDPGEYDQADEDGEIISALALKYPTLIDVEIFAALHSPASLLKTVECCRDLERLRLVDSSCVAVLERSDIHAIVSLPRDSLPA
jgi:hypothetical protein